MALAAGNAPAPAELLGRDEQHVYGADAQRLVRGRRVLVTGAAGSIGSELVRQIRKLSPAAVAMLDVDESRLHALRLETAGHGFGNDDGVFLADVRNRWAVDEAIESSRPDIVFHAAALKHLTLLERHPCEGVLTNVLGTDNVARASEAHGVQRFINISTDKAADPTSVLGATKRIAEDLSRPQSASMLSASVRFGNVLGSRGSFFDTLTHQMRVGGAVTVTHPEVTRFFMSIPEAVGLVIEAAVLASQGEVFVLDMGEPVSILSMVHRFAHLAGLPEPEVIYTGLAAGEKLHEVLFAAGEAPRPTGVNRVSSTATSNTELPASSLLAHLMSAAKLGEVHQVRNLLNKAFQLLNSTFDITPFEHPSVPPSPRREVAAPQQVLV